MARTQAEIDQVYFNLSVAAGERSAKHIEGKLKGYVMNKETKELTNLFHIKKAFDNAWAYLNDAQKNKLCDFASKYFYN